MSVLLLGTQQMLNKVTAGKAARTQDREERRVREAECP